MMNPMDWYMKQEEKRKEQHKLNDILLLNQQIQRLFREVIQDAEAKEKVEESIAKQQHLSRQSPFAPWYRNQMEDMTYGAEVLRTLLEAVVYVEETRQKATWHRLDQLVHQLIRLDFRYNTLLQHEYHEAKRAVFKRT